ncbi:penicillin-sensitive transpeptidase [Aliidiomarina sedimenti]|uniref:Penicillin-binding protein 1A n=1 Tax=Aliidiomarina sedimenti TaxID=1933879 RepID=A0ABY0BY66_9GAMM|nr:PBP1A family penicillin-binding protein [Aliidiomarina sedimenti]RUO29428.1 penicillin-sensitive transpeptidase [Aliidiomarina sedimenti]
MKFLKYLLLTLLTLIIFGLGSVVALYYYVKPELPSVETLRDVRLQIPMQVFTADGKLISQFGEQRRIPLTLDEIPQQLKDAILATEDSRFYEHFGVDPIGVARAFSVLVTTGSIREGASTITMQLARNFFLTRERAWMRKIKEAFIAIHIEQLLSKDEILELYLNKLALGHRAYGVGAAAEVYYGRSLDELTLAEIATISGLPKGPSILNPISNPPASVERRRIVLRRMLDEGYISEEAYQVAYDAPVTARLHGATIEVSAPYLAEMVRHNMVERFGAEQAYTSGYRVYTTVESKHQLAAEKAVRDNLHAYDERHGYRGPVNRLWGEFTASEEADQQQQNLINPETMVIPENRGVEPWSVEEITAYLNRQPMYGPLHPAVVTEVREQSAVILVREGVSGTSEIELDWAALDWARPYIDESTQGEAPDQASDILRAGDHIWVRRSEPDAPYKLAQIPGPSSALVAMHPNNGALAAVVGGYSFQMSQYNRALQAERQVGSTIKPFIYAAAIEDGYTLATIMNDAPITQWNPGSGSAWRPRNSPEVYDGPIRLRKALARSKNVVSVRLIRSVGVDRTADFMQQFGFEAADIPRNESLSLGSASFTPLELTRGFAVFANGGYLVEPHFVARIEDVNGDVLEVANPVQTCADCVLQDLYENWWEHELPQAPRVLSEQTAFLVSDALTSAVWGGGSWPNQTGWNGTAWRAQTLRNRNISGKTGTTNDVNDAWFVGYGSGLVVSTWVGFDNLEYSLGRASLNPNLGRDRQPIVGSEAGATTALPGWIDFMQVAMEDFAFDPFDLPTDIVSVRIDDKTGKLSNQSDYTSLFEYFISGTEPTEFVDIEGNSPRLFEDDDDELF